MAALVLGSCALELSGEGGARTDVPLDGLGRQTAELCASAANVALGKPTTQSSTGWEGAPSRAVDDDRNGDYHHGSVTHSGTTYGFWEVDLLRPYKLRTLNVYNRTDCCTERIVGAVVKLLDERRVLVAQRQIENEGNLFHWSLAEPLRARYIRIEQTNQYLSLAEVEAWADPAVQSVQYDMAARPHGYSSADQGGTNHTNDSWMRFVPDLTLLSQMSLPGTHDAATHLYSDSGAIEWVVRTQSMTVRRQLDAGVRVLDIRCRHYRDRCQLRHGSVSLGADLSVVLDAVGAFLRAHPSEAVIMLLNNPDGNGSDGAPAENSREHFADTFSEAYLSDPRWSDLFWRGLSGLNSMNSLSPAHLPTLQQVRGKIVLFHDFAPQASTGVLGFPGPNFYSLENYADVVHVDKSSYVVMNQGAREEHWQAKKTFLEHVRRSDCAADGRAFHLVGISGSMALGGAAISPSYIASHVNEQANDYVQESLQSGIAHSGIVMIDYPHTDLIENIIAINHATIPAQSFGLAGDFSKINDRIEIDVNGVEVAAYSGTALSHDFSPYLFPGTNEIEVRLGNNDCFGTSLNAALKVNGVERDARSFRKTTSDCGRQLTWKWRYHTASQELTRLSE